MIQNTDMVCHSLLQWTTFCQTSPPQPSRLGWPHTTWLSFIELDKAVARVIRLASFLWLWFQCVCPLMPSRNTYCLTWVSLTLDEGYLLTATPPDLERGVAPFGPCAPTQLLLLGPGVAPLGCCPDLAPLGHRPDLGRGVAPLGPSSRSLPLTLGEG